MASFAAILGLVLAVSAIGQTALPCGHPLRLSAPHLFTHCTSPSTCSYSDYSDWQVVPGDPVSSSACASGKAYQEKRTRTSTSGTGCTDLSETRKVCLPDKGDRLILALGLGGSNQNYKSVTSGGGTTTLGGVQPIPITTIGGGGWGRRVQRLSRVVKPIIRVGPPRVKKCPSNNNVGKMCSHLTGKRSVSLAEKFTYAESAENEIEEDTNENSNTPMPFEWNEHGPRLRRHVQQCNSKEVQHILFVLDSSGSIGSSSYQRMKDAIGKLVPLFCKQVKFAMVTYSTDINLEFCFDCFDNTYSGREKAKQAISNAKYHSRLTYTGATTKCICDELLSSDCGISSTPSCLDVVYITDGQSNDHTHKVCKEVECLHRHSGINTYAIGINNFVKSELDCISHSSNILSAFEYQSFKEFEDSIEEIITRLVTSISNGNHYSCLERDRDISPTGAPYK